MGEMLEAVSDVGQPSSPVPHMHQENHWAAVPYGNSGITFSFCPPEAQPLLQAPASFPLTTQASLGLAALTF